MAARDAAVQSRRPSRVSNGRGSLGQIFVRNVAMVLDARLRNSQHRFSRTV